MSNQSNLPCAYPWQQMIIDLTGEVTPCCFWGGYGNTGKPLGNTNENSLEEIWNGPGYQRLRLEILNNNTEGFPCHQCLAYKWSGEKYPQFTLPVVFTTDSGFCYNAPIPESFRKELRGYPESRIFHNIHDE